jgi:hypothetical protein
MKTMMMMTAAAVVALAGLPAVSQAQVADAISLTNDAINELTDFPANGKRYAVDLNKLGGADVRQMKKATGLLQDALGKARSGNASKAAIMKLEEAVAYGSGTMHKEARLYAQGALYHLCQGASGPGCDTVPKFGSYVAP